MYYKGMRFMYYQQEYILACFKMNGKDYVVLINLNNGNRFAEPVSVDDFNNISKEEMDKVWVGKRINFKLL